MKRAHRLAAITLVEMMVALGVLGGGATTSIAGLLQLNRNATLSRLRTGAGTIAQNQIDYILSIQPFNPQKDQVAPELALGTRTVGTPAAPTTPVYTDPRTGVVNTYGWIVTEVTDLNQTVNGVNLNLRRATVTVFYKFCGKTYNVELTTVRGSDI